MMPSVSSLWMRLETAGAGQRHLLRDLLMTGIRAFFGKGGGSLRSKSSMRKVSLLKICWNP